MSDKLLVNSASIDYETRYRTYEINLRFDLTCPAEGDIVNVIKDVGELKVKDLIRLCNNPGSL